MLFIFIFVIIVAIVLSLFSVKIVPQSETYVIEKLGAYKTTWEVGVHFKLPHVDRIANKVNMKELVEDLKPQPVITADNVTMEIDTVVYYQVVDPKLYTYGVDNPVFAMENLTATTLRNIIGNLELDETLTSRDTINIKMKAVLEDATRSWGIQVNRVEVKNIMQPEDIRIAMEKQMMAERGRREAILKAEGEKKSLILIAEGEREAGVLRAKGEKEAQILKAQAIKEEKKLIAEGEAQATLNTQRATAHGYKMIKAAKIDESVIALRRLEAFEKAADGKATKIIIPSDLQDISGAITGMTEIAETEIEDDGVLKDDDGNKL